MAKKKKNMARTFGVAVRVESRAAGKDSQQYGVQVRVTGGQWIGNAVQGLGRLLQSRLLAKGAVLAIVAAIVRLAS